MTKPRAGAFFTDIDTITIPKDRVRDDLGDIEALAISIRDSGLINPIILDQNNSLIAGLRRLAATKLLDHDKIECRFYEDLTDFEKQKIKIEEQLGLKQLHWTEECILKKQLHVLYKQFKEQGRSKKWTQRETANILGVKVTTLSEEIRLAYSIEENPELKKLSSKREAIKNMYRHRELSVLKEKASRKIQIAPTKQKLQQKQAQAQEQKKKEKITPTKEEDGHTSKTKPTQKTETERKQSDASAQRQSNQGENKPYSPTQQEEQREEAREAAIPELMSEPAAEQAVTLNLLEPLAPDIQQYTNKQVCAFNANCFDVLPKISDSSIDLIVTDPPYGVGMQKVAVRAYQHKQFADTQQGLYTRAIPHFYRILTDGSHLYLFCSLKFLDEIKKLLTDAGFDVRELPLIWKKRRPTYAPNWEYTMSSQYETFVFAKKTISGVARKLNKPVSDMFEYTREKAQERVHLTQKPIDLMKRLISLSSFPGDLVLDPFSGSGSTLIAAALLERRAVGVELDADIFKIAVGRMVNMFDGKAETKEEEE